MYKRDEGKSETLNQSYPIQFRIMLGKWMKNEKFPQWHKSGPKYKDYWPIAVWDHTYKHKTEFLTKSPSFIIENTT